MSDSNLESALRRVLSTDLIRRAPTLSRVLSYLAHAEIAGERQALTPYRVAVEAFGKPEDFDPATSAAVRVEMARLRRILLEDRRLNPEEVGLEIPRGTYQVKTVEPASQPRPEFSRYAVHPAGPGLMLFDLQVDAIDTSDIDLLDIAGALGRMLYEEIVAYRWLHVVDARGLQLGGADPFAVCTDRHACQFLLRGRMKPGADPTSFVLEIELMDAVARTCAWRERFEISLESLNATGRAVAETVGWTVGAPIVGVITNAAAAAKPVNAPDERSAAAALAVKFQRYRALQRTAEANAQLHAELEAMLVRWPLFALGWSMLGVLETDRATHGFAPPEQHAQALARARSMHERAIELDPVLDLSHILLARLHFLARDIPRFRSYLRRTLDLNPGNPEWRFLGGALLCQSGDVASGIELIDSTNLATHHATIFRLTAGQALWAAGRAAEAVTALETVSDENPVYNVPVMRALALASSGSPEAAKAALRNAETRSPGISRNLRAELSRWFIDEALLQRALTTLDSVVAGLD